MGSEQCADLVELAGVRAGWILVDPLGPWETATVNCQKGNVLNWPMAGPPL